MSPSSQSKFPAVIHWIRKLKEKSITINDGLRRRNDNFLIIRIIAACMVIYAHAPALAPAVNHIDIFAQLGVGNYSGMIAVNIFFLISGFLVTGSLLRQENNILNFFKLRALRLIPAFFVNLAALALIIGPIATHLPITEYLTNSGTWKYIIQNMTFSTHMIWSLPGVIEAGEMAPIDASSINGSIWSIPAEVRMYTLLGLLGLFGAFSSKRIATNAILILIGIGATFPQYLPLHNSWLEPGIYFGIGTLVFLHRDSIQLNWLLSIGLIILAIFTRHLPSYQITFPLELSGIIFALAYLTPTFQFLEKYGDPSYGIYLWGWPCQQFIAHTIPQAGLLLHTGLSIFLAVTMGYLSWHLIEKHALKFK